MRCKPTPLATHRGKEVCECMKQRQVSVEGLGLRIFTSCMDIPSLHQPRLLIRGFVTTNIVCLDSSYISGIGHPFETLHRLAILWPPHYTRSADTLKTKSGFASEQWARGYPI